ncbi:MAG: transporter [Rhizobiales bacterium PAR1]|nr:MAG: transporter [Rhizobiales bacterium PAR1]
MPPLLISALAIVAPVFSLVAIGYLAARLGLVSERAGNGLSEFVFVLAIPALLFRTVASTEFPHLNPLPYWASYFVGLLICWLVAAAIARRLGRPPRETAIIGFAAAQSNTVMIGIPLILGVFGEAGTVPIILLLIIHSPLTMTATALLIARHETGSGGLLLRLIKAILSNPILVAIGMGLLWRMGGVPLPGTAKSVLKFLGDTASPCALVAMGMSMTRIALEGNKRLIGVISALKLVLHPALVYVMAVPILHLPPLMAGSALLFAACPTGVNAYLLAERYRAGQSVTSGAISLTTMLAIFTMTFVVSVVMGFGK